MTAIRPALAGVARIGPNAINRVAEVLPSFIGLPESRALFELAGLSGYLASPPEAMVDEAEVTRLHRALRAQLGAEVAGEVAGRAGRKTADYLLAHRIPRVVQAVLKVLPAALAARVLLSAIRQHAWTFSGSGVFTAQPGQPVVLNIQGNPLCKGMLATAPACNFYAATFERLFQVLVHPQARVREVACEAMGASSCRFEVRW